MSEIPCLGSVPAHWKSSKFKFHHFEEDDTVGEYSEDYPLLSLTKEGVVFRDIESGKGKFPASFENYKVVHPDRLIFCLFDIDETPRTIGLSNHFGMITGAYKLFRTTHDLIPRFSLYTFLVIDNVKGLKPYYTGLRKVVRPETFKSLEFSLPPLHEQEQIVEYLDRKTTLIDSLIEKTVRKIELLKEKRTSLINEVVTKGLNPDVEMKDSGVEWIGEIPSHWGFEKTKTLCERKKKTISVEEFKNQNVIHYSIPNVQAFGAGVKELGEDIDSSKLLLLGGEVLVSKLNPRKGCVTRVRFHNDIMVIGSGEFIPLVPGRNLSAEFFHYFIQSPRYSEFLDSNVESVTRSHQRVSPDVIYDLRVPLPQLSEQEHIVEYLDEQTSIIDSTITTEEKRIELLKEYRQSLISEVVTGKVKVTRDE